MTTKGLQASHCAAGSCFGDLMEPCQAPDQSQIALVLFSLSLKAWKDLC